MKPLTLQEIRHTVNGKALGAIPADALAIKSICTDSRQVEHEQTLHAGNYGFVGDRRQVTSLPRLDFSQRLSAFGVQ